jgi:hypothetical protein
VGRSATAATDATLKAQVLSYSRNEGIFAGVALDGTVISVDNASNVSAYGVSDILPSQILGGSPSMAPPAAQAFTAALNKATGGVATPSPAATPAENAPPPGDPAEPSPTDGATTYPMEDPEPGAPPPP